MSQNLTFVKQINTVYNKCSQLMGWILRTFISRERTVTLLLFKSLVLSRVDNGSQLWSPHHKQHICFIEKIQRSFTKHIDGMKDLSYPERLCALKLYSLQRRRDRYIIIYMWKIVEKVVPNLNTPITWKLSERRGRLCDVLSVVPGAVGTKCYHSFKWHAIRLFNSLLTYLMILQPAGSRSSMG